jgi:osmotically-inducible protein OsmY
MAQFSAVADRGSAQSNFGEWQHELLRQTLGHHLFRSRQIDVCADQGVVVLQGEVQSFYEKQLAQEVVRRIDGVQRVENEIEVAYG